MKISIFNLMLIVAVVALSLIMFFERYKNDNSILVRDQFGYGRFELPKRYLNEATAWRPDRSEVPLSPTDLNKVCKQVAQDLSTIDDSVQWSHSSVSLIAINNSLEHWCYLVVFEGRLLNIALNGPAPTFSALVLFDKSVIISDGRNYVDDHPGFPKKLRSKLSSLNDSRREFESHSMNKADRPMCYRQY